MTHTAESITERYDAYQDKRTQIRNQVRAEVEARVDEIMAIELREMSRALHEAYADGVTKGELRRAVRAGGNAPAFRRLWEPAQDEFPNEAAPRVGRPRLDAAPTATQARKKETWVVDEASHTLTIEPVEGETLHYNVIYNETFGWIVDLKWATPEFAFHKEYGREAFETQLAPMTEDWELPAEDPEGEL